jgi:hypothetical protein
VLSNVLNKIGRISNIKRKADLEAIQILTQHESIFILNEKPFSDPALLTMEQNRKCLKKKYEDNCLGANETVFR